MASTSAGEKRCRSTIVARRARPICSPAKPQAWNSGAEISIRTPAVSGIRSMIEQSGLNPPGVGRRAPLGTPVVPEVSTIVRPGRAGGSTSPAGARSSRSERTASTPGGGSNPASWTRARNS